MKVIDHLLQQKVITEEQFLKAKKETASKGISLIQSILELACVKEDQALKIIADHYGVETKDISQESVNFDLMELLPESFIKRNHVLPLEVDDDCCLKVVISDPTNVFLRDDLRELTSYEIRPVLASRIQIQKKLDEYYQKGKLNGALESALNYSKDKIDLDDQMITARSAILNADKSPIVNLVDNIIINAFKEKASDIHIEPLEGKVELRFRIDGVLREKLMLPKSIHNHLVSRIKVMADLNISEKRRPQDGRINFESMGKRLNLRVSTLSTVHGEKVVMRILDSAEVNLDVSHLGMNDLQHAQFTNMLKQPQGMILVCGPTGSGKTSTLYSAVKHIKNKATNIITIEDPVEYSIEGVNQTQVNAEIGYTFAAGLKTILRQDPDVILVGEIRDGDTANIGFRASLTGHLVLSTVHTNCSISAVTRLKDIGVEPFLISSSLLGVVAQRLVRINCEHCLAEYEPMNILLDKYKNILGKSRKKYYKGCGCQKCDMTGYKGRAAIFEILPFTKNTRQLVVEGAAEEEIRSEVLKCGFISLLESGLKLFTEGRTTLEEIESVAGSFDEPNHEKKMESEFNQLENNSKKSSSNSVEQRFRREFLDFMTQFNGFL